MKFRRKEKNYKYCPRCGMKCLISAETCPDCDLVFSRIDFATNKDAKKKIARGDRDFIIHTSKLPSDVSFVKLLLLSIFTGLFGGHSFYVGKYLRGTIALVDTLILIMFTIFNNQLIAIDGGTLLGALATVCGLFMIMWPIDIVLIIMKKFKVPIAIDIDTEIKQEEKEEI